MPNQRLQSDKQRAYCLTLSSTIGQSFPQLTIPRTAFSMSVWASTAQHFNGPVINIHNLPSSTFECEEPSAAIQQFSHYNSVNYLAMMSLDRFNHVSCQEWPLILLRNPFNPLICSALGFKHISPDSWDCEVVHNVIVMSSNCHLDSNGALFEGVHRLRRMRMAERTAPINSFLQLFSTFPLLLFADWMFSVLISRTSSSRTGLNTHRLQDTTRV